MKGAWYTVGYEMCRLVELQYGRRRLVAALKDPRELLVLYNKAATRQNHIEGTHLRLWSHALIKGLYTKQ